MSEKYMPKKGDRVRVVLEGEVGWVGGSHFEFVNGADYIGHKDGKNTVSIEKIEPPVEVFKPGDVVRHKGNEDGHWFAIAEDGWLIVGPGWRIKHHFTKGDPSKEFTSDVFEKVGLGR
jgi:hypothetical protein